MNIAIDYDGTLDQDVTLWAEFIRSAESRGHRCFVVSSRQRDDEDREIVSNIADLPMARVIFTDMTAKRWYCERLGLQIDVWIDDDPASVMNGK